LRIEDELRIECGAALREWRYMGVMVKIEDDLVPLAVPGVALRVKMVCVDVFGVLPPMIWETEMSAIGKKDIGDGSLNEVVGYDPVA
jgi:hypothetical protein